VRQVFAATLAGRRIPPAVAPFVHLLASEAAAL
jgi:hypothetical protein